MKPAIPSFLKSSLLILIGTVLGYFLAGPIRDVQLILSPPPAPVTAREAWRDFTQRIDAVAERILASDFPSATDRERAEGIRQLTHVIVDGLRWEFDNASAEFTGLIVNNTDTSGWGGPNVDNKYLRGRIDGGSTYLLSGNIGSLYDIAIQTNRGDLHMGQVGASETLDLSTLEVDARGNFVVTISPEFHEGNWIKQDPDHTILTIRAYYLDWTTSGDGQFYLVREGQQGIAPPALSEKEAARRLANAAHWIESNLVGWDKWLKLALANADENSATAPRAVGGGSSSLLYGGISYALAPGEALVVELEDPQADYYSFQTYTLGWFDAGDYANHQTSLNSAQVRRDADGKIRLVISAQDPEVPNWIDTEGRERGVVTYRYMRAKNPDQPRVTLVPVTTIRGVLPADTPVVTPRERRETISVRQRHVQQRFHN